MPAQPWRPEQCAQIVEAFKVADITTELDKQIRDLQRSASEHDVKQDEQLQHVKDLRAKVEGGLASLALGLEKVQAATVTDVATKAGQQVQLDASKELQSSISQLSAALEDGTKEMKQSMQLQKDLILVIKTFLEEKVAIQERAIAEAEVSSDLSENKSESSKWPSATLSAAHFAVTLLSTVVSTVTAVSVAKQSRNAQAPTPMLSSKVPDIPRTISFTTSDYTEPKSEITYEAPSQSRASTWVSDFSRSSRNDETSSITQNTSTPKLPPSDSASAHVVFGGYSGDASWSKKISKLDDSDSDNDGRNGIGKHRRYPDTTYLDGPGPALPPSNERLTAGTGHGRHSSRHHGHHSHSHHGGHHSGYSGGYIGGDSGGGNYSGGYSGGHDTSESDSDSD